MTSDNLLRLMSNLRVGMTATVTLRIPQSGKRVVAGVLVAADGGLYCDGCLVRCANYRPSPFVEAVEVEDDPDENVEALARLLSDASSDLTDREDGDAKWIDLGVRGRATFRRVASKIIAAGWSQHEPQTRVVDCFDGIDDDTIQTLATRPEDLPLRVIMSVATVRATNAHAIRRADKSQ